MATECDRLLGLRHVLLLFGIWGVISAQTHYGYEKDVLLSLCQYIGIRYVINPDDPDCSYIECDASASHDMPCAPGLKVHPNFLWGSSYPCTEKDSGDSCSYFKKHLKKIEKTKKKKYRSPLTA